MSTLSEIKNIPEKFQTYRDKLIELLKAYNIKNVKELIVCYQTNKRFKDEWITIWEELAKAEGGKLSLTTIGIIYGSVLGGVGIATAGSAIGLPLALILGLSGFLLGNKIDDKSISINLSIDLLNKLEKDSTYTRMSVSNLIEHLIELTYENSIDHQQTFKDVDNEIGLIESSINFWSDIDLSDHTIPAYKYPLLNDEDIPCDTIDCDEYREIIDELNEEIEINKLKIEEMQEHINSLEYNIQYDLGIMVEEDDECKR